VATSAPSDRAYLLYTLPALAVFTPLLALLCLAIGIGPRDALLRICMVFLLVSPATGLLGLRTLARVGSAAPPAVHRIARTWCALALITPLVLYLGLHWVAPATGGGV